MSHPAKNMKLAKPPVRAEADRAEAKKLLLAKAEKRFGKGAVTTLDDKFTADVPVIPTGSLALDRALGVGGYPRGRLVEVFGPEASGKTTLTLHAIAQVQRGGGVAAFIDAEHAFDLRYAKAIGVNTSELLISQPDFGEQALDIAELLAESGAVDLVVIDSVAALVPKAELEGEMGDLQVGSQARLMAKATRKLAGVANNTKTTMMFINQIRQKIGVVFGSPETTPGGNALKFFASVRLDVRRIGKVLVGDQNIGNRTRVRVIKNKVAAPFKDAELDIRWGIGIDTVTDLIDMALDQGVLEKKGAHYSFRGKPMAQGREKVRETLLANAELHRAVREATVSAMCAVLDSKKEAAA